MDAAGFSGGAAEDGRCGVGERADKWGCSPSARGEREDVEDGRRESKKKMYFVEYAKGTHEPSGLTKGTTAYGRGGPTE
jgi:hypothetical protein